MKFFERARNPEPVIHDSGFTFFHRMCFQGELEIAEMLVEKSAKFGIHLNCKDGNGKTGFHLACEKGRFNIVKMLIQKSNEFHIDLNIQDDSGKTAFHWACFRGHLEVSTNRSKTNRLQGSV